MIEHGFSKDSFLGGWYIDHKICDDLITLFHKNKSYHKDGMQRFENKSCVIKENKDSTDFNIHPDYMGDVVGDYRRALQSVLENYNKKFPDSARSEGYNVKENYMIQHYKPGGGYKIWHHERGELHNSSRVLVFMTYLNDVDDGGTFFKHQKLLTPAKKGLTIIWPTDWTHTHKGQISQTKEKYLITGWFNFYE